MRYSKIRKMDISNGPGYRVSLFTQGCLRHCTGCFNQETWNPQGGLPFTDKEYDLILSLGSNPNVVGLSILGGEPLLPENLKILFELLSHFRLKYPTKTIWLWTGYDFENLNSFQKDVVNLCDVVIAGPYLSYYHDTSLKYAGSINQKMWTHHFKEGNWTYTYAK